MIYQLNKYPADRYNVLVPVTTLQAESNLQKITVSEVQLDTRQNYDNKGPSKDIYFEKSSNGYAITKVGGMKLAAAANISIISTTPGRTSYTATVKPWLSIFMARFSPMTARPTMPICAFFMPHPPQNKCFFKYISPAAGCQ